MVNCTAAADTPKARAVSGSAGMIRCMPSVPHAVIATISANGARLPLPNRGVLCHSMRDCFLQGRSMPNTDASTLPATGRRRSLAAAIASVTVFGLSVGQAAPLVSLLLEQRGVDASLNGLNTGCTFVGVMIGPLLAPR